MGIVSSLMGVSMAKVTSVSSHSLSSNKITLQANQLASDKAEFLKSETYSSLASQGKKSVTGSLYYDEVTVGKETVMPSNQDIKQKPCRVNVYYGDESIPRATLSFNRYSVSQNESSIPKGTILPWYGKSSDIPEGFALCDGTKGTPDLRNRFLVGAGAGSYYALGDTGGEDQVRLTNQQIGNHYHYWSGMYTSDPHYETYKRTGLKLVSFGYDSNISSYFDAPFPTGKKMLCFFTKDAIRNIYGRFVVDDIVGIGGYNSQYSPNGAFKVVGSAYYDARSHESWNGCLVSFNTSYVVPTANEDRPINRAVRYFIKVA